MLEAYHKIQFFVRIPQFMHFEYTHALRKISDQKAQKQETVKNTYQTRSRQTNPTEQSQFQNRVQIIRGKTLEKMKNKHMDTQGRLS